MSNVRLAFLGLINALSVLIYTALIAWILFNGNSIFGRGPSLVGLIALLLLFVLSAAIVGTLVLGRPIILYVNGLRSSAVKLFFYTVAWLMILTVAVFAAHLWRY